MSATYKNSNIFTIQIISASALRVYIVPCAFKMARHPFNAPVRCLPKW